MTITKTELVNRLNKLQDDASRLFVDVDEVLDYNVEDQLTTVCETLSRASLVINDALSEVESEEFDEAYNEDLTSTAPDEEEDITDEELKEPWDKDDTEAQLAWIMDECYKLYPVNEWKDAVLRTIEDRNAAIRRSILATGTYRPMIRNPFVK